MPEFYTMCFMPYARLPAHHPKYSSIRVELPNESTNLDKNSALYMRCIDELILADTLGFDGISLNEHYGAPYSMMPSPSPISAMLASRTKKAKINVWGVAPNLEFPNRLAEQYAMLDIMSGGRIQVVFPVASGMECSVHDANVGTESEHIRESVKIILKCWTDDHPTSFEGRFYKYPHLNAWPRPVQKPYPPCFVLGNGSIETIEFAAEMGWGLICAFVSRQKQIELFKRLRERAAKHGHTIHPNQIPLNIQAYVADTEKQARKEFEPHIRWFYETGIYGGPSFLGPPGYITSDQIRERTSMTHDLRGGFDWDLHVKNFHLVAGPPDMIANKVGELMEEAGSSAVNFTTHLGDMPHWKTVRNLTLLAEEVLPRLRSRTVAGRKVDPERTTTG